MLKYPNIDPIIFHIYGNLALRWYSLAYIVGFLLCYFWLKRKNNEEKFISNDLCEKLMTMIVFGLIIGARVFDCIFYHFNETIAHPMSMFRIWDGGMSFHGGAIGVLCVFFFFSKKYKVSVLKILDYCLIVVPVALFFGRIANFINGELYGNITYTSPFRMIFPTDYTHQPRHPSQLYEAFSEGICLFIIALLLYKKTNFIKTSGLLTSCLAIFYSIFRFICEFFRSPEIDNLLGLTAGQWLSIIMFLISFIFFISKLKESKS